MAKPSKTPSTPPMSRETRLLVELIQTNQFAAFLMLLLQKRFRTAAVLNGETLDGDWPLRVAARFGRLRFAIVLHAAGADLNKRSFGGTHYTALWEAEDTRHSHMAQWLLKKGATQFPRYVTKEPPPKSTEIGPAKF